LGLIFPGQHLDSKLILMLRNIREFHIRKMKELREIINAYHQATANGKHTALATLVHVEGSSYRRPGARMLITDEGELTGAISGGCLEGDALRKAQLAIAQHKPRLVTYDTSDESDRSIGVQLGCAGIIHVLIEPIDAASENNPIQLLEQLSGLRQPAVAITLFNMEDRSGNQPGTSAYLLTDGTYFGTIPEDYFENELKADGPHCFETKQSRFITYQKNEISITAFLEYLAPNPRLIIVGAGNDAIPLSQFANVLGWEVHIVDGRNTHARPERFEPACQIIVSDAASILEKIIPDTYTAWMMMTHNYNYDLAMLRALHLQQTPYIGMLGPRKKLEHMLSDLHKEGIIITDDQLKNIYGPAGIDLGAETPEAIALSIVSEIQAVFSGIEGASLRNRNTVIHDRKNLKIELRRLQ
jgi:xanthine dehydrogenase accessory factor